MYESFFRLSGRPFAAAPNRHQYFAAGAVQHARQTLARCIARAEGPALLIGPAGTGKTLLCQLLADDFQDQFDCVSLASGNLGTARSLLQVILHELELPYRGLDEGELRLALADRVLRQRAVPSVLLLVDEAQVLPVRLLEELRLLTNLVREGQPQVRLVLAGSAELEERFASPKLESFNQRIAARAYLEAFSREETRAYVAARIAASGPEVSQVFAADAVDQIHLATEGIPRLINQLADHALVLGYAGGVRPLDSRVIAEAWSDLQQLPTPWNQANPTRGGEAAGEPDTIEFGSLELDDEPAAPSHEARNWQPVDEELAPVPWPHFAGSIVTHTEPAATDPARWNEERAPFEFPADAHLGEADLLEDEVVIDPYATLDAKHNLIRHRVVSAEGRALWQQLAPHAAAALRQSVRIVDEAEIDLDVAAASSAPLPQGFAGDRVAGSLPRVESESRGRAPLAAEFRGLPPIPEPAALPPAPPVNEIDPDADLIIVEDDMESLELAQAPGFGRARRQDYRQLFKKLRNAN